MRVNHIIGCRLHGIHYYIVHIAYVYITRGNAVLVTTTTRTVLPPSDFASSEWFCFSFLCELAWLCFGGRIETDRTRILPILHLRFTSHMTCTWNNSQFWILFTNSQKNQTLLNTFAPFKWPKKLWILARSTIRIFQYLLKPSLALLIFIRLIWLCLWLTRLKAETV